MGGSSNQNIYHSDFPKISSNYDKKAPSVLNNPQPVPYQKVTKPNNSKGYEQQLGQCTRTFSLHFGPDFSSKDKEYTCCPKTKNCIKNNPLTHYETETLVGKFSTAMPKVELIRKNFIQQNQLSGGGGALITILGIFY